MNSIAMGNTDIRGICSMATRGLLAELCAEYAQRSGIAIDIEAAGGVDAAKRVSADEPFDVVFLAADAIARLAAAGKVDPTSQTALVTSGVAAAVPAGALRPDLSSEAAVRAAVLAAPRIAYSTGPSGVALLELFQRWGVGEQLRNRLLQAPSGVPVGTLLARGEATLGFQQLSELIGLPGIELLGPLPEPIRIDTVFSGAICTAGARPEAARALLGFLASPACDESKRRHGMAPA
ncbi:substrate-binding domain-containing protein [Variovorax sp. OV329]|uniref:substrate-binding domain-containing protein n=1 Tax=Variovorax sp. OV329 TaxID=1882825 RepID=UPI0008E7D373|nr:substrate-binding domain-containing protein [Variovorax sp. OV329]SFL86524.1 molybdate transport system substrate-binding protein [Variovorax sp. OV329]